MEFTVKPNASTCIVLDIPHHYRGPFLGKLSKRMNLFVVFSSSTAKDRRGLAPEMSSELDFLVLSDLPFDQCVGKVWESIKLFLACAVQLCRIRPGIVIVHGYFNPACWAGPILKPLLGYNLVVWGESNEFDKPRKWWVEYGKQLFFKSAEQCHVYGRSAKTYFEKLGMPASRVLITQPTVRERVFVQSRKGAQQQSSGPCRLIYVGRFEPEKNLERFLRALTEYYLEHPSSRITLTMVGFGTQETLIREFVVTNDLCQRITVRGQTQQEELAEIISQHDILVLPSVYEPYGLVALEAMLVGLPIFISNNCGCAADLVSDSTGWLMDPEDTKSMQDGLSAIEECEPDEYSKKCVAATALADSYSTEASVELTVRALRQWL
jgi:glycosyltransferase involved in cell wall biosynthesis